MHRQVTLKAVSIRKKLFTNKQKTTPKKLTEIMTFPMSLLCMELTSNFPSATLALCTLVHADYMGVTHGITKRRFE